MTTKARLGLLPLSELWVKVHLGMMWGVVQGTYAPLGLGGSTAETSDLETHMGSRTSKPRLRRVISCFTQAPSGTGSEPEDSPHHPAYPCHNPWFP